MRTTGEIEGFYRLMNSDGFTAAQLLEPHRKATIGRAARAGTVLVVHDTTHVEFSGDGQREGLGVTTNGRQGFVGHFSLVLDSQCESVPLGVARMETYTRTGKNGRLRRKRALAYAMTRNVNRSDGGARSKHSNKSGKANLRRST